jgi:DNA-binding XRE family transcriptional regulator
MQEKLLTKRLKVIRRSKKFTREKLASLTGLSKGYLSQIENSDQPPPIYTLSRISGALGIDISDLFVRPAVSENRRGQTGRASAVGGQGWKVGGRSGAAAILGLKPTTLFFRMKKLGITKPSSVRLSQGASAA